MKKFFLILSLFLSIGFVQAEELPNIQVDLRDYHGIIVPTGTFIPVMNTQEISTQTCSEGTKLNL